MDKGRDKMTNSMLERERSNMMAKLSGTILHDFKNILAIISGLAQLSTTTTNIDEIHTNLKLINRAAFDCSGFIDVITVFTKGLEDKDMKPKYFNDIFLSIINMIKYKLNLNPDKKIELDCNLSSKAIINCNEYEVRQSLANLIFNAVESMEENGGLLKVSTFDIDKELVIEIIDHGVGISEENLNRIFEPYFTTKGDKGTGLGMKIVKDTVESHGARINVESIVGQGTKVSIYVPIIDYIE